MLGRPSDEGPFVIIEHDSDRFVQFACCATEPQPLLLYASSHTWPEAVFYKANAYFKEHGIAAEKDWLEKEEKPNDPDVVFSMFFRSVDKATEVAVEIFEEVYDLPTNVELTVITSWET
jgi:hypothetical protein